MPRPHLHEPPPAPEARLAGTLPHQLQDALGPAYTIARELGGGGMSRVFVARDRELDRDIVVKVLPEDAAASLSSDRFRREIALAAKLQHPHIVPLIAAGETADGLPFSTMPWIEGETLGDRLMREGELPVADAIGILRGMLHVNYAVTPDGRHFAFLASGGGSSRDAVVTLNWTNELAVRLAKGK